MFACLFVFLQSIIFFSEKKGVSVAKVVLVASMALGHMDDAGTRVHTPI